MRVFVIDEAMDSKLVAGINANPAITVSELKGLEHAKICPRTAKTASTGASEHAYKRFGRTVQDGKFEGVQFDVNVVNPAGI